MTTNRKVVFSNGEIYHVLNRAIAKEEVFLELKDLNRMLNLIEYYKKPQSLKYSAFNKLSIEAKQTYLDKSKSMISLVEIYAFAIMPNHFHLLLKQISDKGITTFTSNIQNSYAKYFNKREDRDGGLFKRPFRASHVTNDETFLHVLRYIHLNPVTSFLIEFKDLRNYEWTSYSHYTHKDMPIFVNSEFGIDLLGNLEKFQRFTANQENYQKTISSIKRILLE